MKSFHGFIFRQIQLFWENLRLFFRNHKTLFDILFLTLYTVQQVFLFLLILIWPEYAHISSGIFALVVITTISFEKICMESRYNWLKEGMVGQEMEKQIMIAEYQNLEQDNKELRESLRRIKRK